jgi:lipid-A-disaccharide synthase
MLNLDYIGLANIFSLDFQNRPMHPELIQHELSVDNLLEAFRKLDKKQFMDDVCALRDYLGHGSAGRVSRILLERT